MTDIGCHTSRGLWLVLLLAAMQTRTQGQTLSCDLDVTFMVDFTGSMAGERYSATLDLIQGLVEKSIVSNSNVQVGLLYFGDSEAQLATRLSLADIRSKQEVLDEITTLRVLTPNFDGPAAKIALSALRSDTQVSRAGNRDFGILLTDSFTNDVTGAYEEADSARNDGISIITVGLGPDVPSDQLDRLSQGQRFSVLSAADVSSVVDGISDVMCPAQSTPAPDPVQNITTNLDCKADVLFMIDYTRSMGEGETVTSRYQTILNAILYVATTSVIGPENLQYGIMVFGETVQVVLPLSRDVITSLDDVLAAVDAMRADTPSSNGIRYDLALDEMIRQLNGSRPGTRDVAVLLADSSINAISTVENIATKARNQYGIDIVGISIGDDLEFFDLFRITGSNTDTFQISNITDFGLIQQEVVDRICPLGDTPECQFLDIGFVLDASGSITGSDAWQNVIDFSRQFVQNFRVGDDFLRFGLLYFKQEATLSFDVSSFQFKSEVLSEISALSNVEEGGDTNIAAGLRMLTDEMFPASGGRGAPKVALLITDGFSKVDRSQTPIEAQRARDAGIQLFAVGVGSEVDIAELTNITADPDKVIEIMDFDQLLLTLDPLIKDVCPNCTDPGDWVIVLDSSGSVGEDNFVESKVFVERLIETMSIDDGTARLGLMRFADFGDIQWHLADYGSTTELLLALARVRYTGGSTNTSDAIRRARTTMFTEANGDRAGERNVMIIFTDGGSNDFTATVEEARLARLQGITVLVVGITDWVNWREVYEIASDPDHRNTFNVTSFDTMMEQAFTDLRTAACNDNNECNPDPCLNGGVCVDEVNNYYCVCPDGYAGQHCQYACTERSDIAFVVDASGSLYSRDYYAVQNCYKHLARGLNVDSGHRIGLVNFNGEVYQRYNLTSYNSSKQVVDATSFPWLDGSTDAAGALTMAREDILDDGTVRPGARKIAVYASDGHSSDRPATFREAARTHEDDVSVLSIALDVKGRYAEQELDGVTSDPDSQNRYYHDEACDFVDNMILQICNGEDNCSPDPCSDQPCVDGINSYECVCGADSTGTNCTLGCSGVIDLGFLLDVSGSIQEGRFREYVLPFVSAIVDHLEVREAKTRVGLVTFDWDETTNEDRSTVQFSLGQYSRKEDIQHAIRRLPYQGGRTNMADGLRTAREQLYGTDRPDAPNVLVVVSDGQSNVRPDSTIPEAVLTRESGIHVIVASIESNSANLELRGVASRPWSETVVDVQRYSLLPGLVGNVVDALCDDIDQCSSLPDPCSGRGSCIDRHTSYWCQCDAGRVGPTCQYDCSADGDIAFVIDASGSVDDFELSLQVLYAVSERLNFQTAGMRAGVILYQDTATIQIPLNRYTSLMAFLNALRFDRDITIKGTNTADAFQILRNEFFVPGNGDRNGVPNTAIVMSDGRSNINPENTIPEAENLRGDSVRLVAVAIGSDVDVAEIEGIANKPTGSHVFGVESAGNVVPVAEAIIDLLCNL